MYNLQILTMIIQFNEVNNKKKAMSQAVLSELTVNICMYKHQNAFRVK